MLAVNLGYYCNLVLLAMAICAVTTIEFKPCQVTFKKVFCNWCLTMNSCIIVFVSLSTASRRRWTKRRVVVGWLSIRLTDSTHINIRYTPTMPTPRSPTEVTWRRIDTSLLYTDLYLVSIYLFYYFFNSIQNVFN